MLRSSLLCLVFLARVVAAFTASHCQQQCGNVTVPYPFGIGDRTCFKEDAHELICNQTYDPPLLLLGPDSNVPVLNISLQGQLTVSLWVAYDCYNQTGESSKWYNQEITLPQVYSFSDTQNKFTAIGCDTSAFMSDPDGNMFESGCVSLCTDTSHVIDGSCSGIGCCQTSIPRGLRTLNIDLGSYHNHTKSWKFNPCSYAFLAHQDWFQFRVSDLWNFSNNNPLSFENVTSAPVVLEWVSGFQTCQDIPKNITPCGLNSFCSNSTSGLGYRCYCDEGYEGNPYLPQGCQGINTALFAVNLKLSLWYDHTYTFLFCFGWYQI